MKRLLHGVPNVFRYTLGAFAVVAVTMLLAVGWLRFLVPSRAPERVRDVTWLRLER